MMVRRQEERRAKVADTHVIADRDFRTPRESRESLTFRDARRSVRVCYHTGMSISLRCILGLPPNTLGIYLPGKLRADNCLACSSTTAINLVT